MCTYIYIHTCVCVCGGGGSQASDTHTDTHTSDTHSLTHTYITQHTIHIATRGRVLSRYHNYEEILTTQTSMWSRWSCTARLVKNYIYTFVFWKILTSRCVLQVDLSGKTFRPSREAVAIKMVGDSLKKIKKNPLYRDLILLNILVR